MSSLNRQPYAQEFRDSQGKVLATLSHESGNFEAQGYVKPGASYTQAITAAGAIDLDAAYVGIAGGTGFAVTLAAPTRSGLVKVIKLESITSGEVTLALTNVYGGTATTSASFDAANETLVLVSAGAKWLVLKEQGVTLA